MSEYGWQLLAESRRRRAEREGTTPSVRKASDVSKKEKSKKGKATKNSPRPLVNPGSYVPVGSSWQVADAFDRPPSGDIPLPANGASQREQIREIAQLTQQMEKCRKAGVDPSLIAELGQQVTLRKLKLLAAQELGVAAAVKNANNGGDISGARERAAEGQVNAQLAGVGRTNPKYQNSDAPVSWSAQSANNYGDDDTTDEQGRRILAGTDEAQRAQLAEVVKLRKALDSATDPLVRDDLSQRLTLSQLRLLHATHGPSSAVSAIHAQRADARRKGF